MWHYCTRAVQGLGIAEVWDQEGPLQIVVWRKQFGQWWAYVVISWRFSGALLLTMVMYYALHVIFISRYLVSRHSCWRSLVIMQIEQLLIGLFALQCAQCAQGLLCPCLGISYYTTKRKYIQSGCLCGETCLRNGRDGRGRSGWQLLWHHQRSEQQF